jgi:hypothetical protein
MAVAGKFAVILHRMGTTGTTFHLNVEAATALSASKYHSPHLAAEMQSLLGRASEVRPAAPRIRAEAMGP